MFPMRWVSFTSRTCLARSSPKRNFAEAFVSEEQRAWNSGFKAGFICSRRKRDISLAVCPSKATISILLVSSSFLEGPLKSVMRSNLSAFVRVANVAFWKACCKLASRRSAFFLKEFSDCQISELTRGTVISTQFSGGSYLVKRLDIFSLFKLLAPTFVGHFGQLFVDGRTLFILVPEGGSQLLKNFIVVFGAFIIVVFVGAPPSLRHRANSEPRLLRR